MTTILNETGAHTVGGEVSNDDLWISAGDLERISGWQLKPEGLCQGDVCIPSTGDSSFVTDDKVNVASFWRSLDRPVLHDAAGDTWVLGQGHSDRANTLTSLEAPDFTLPDFDGKLHSLSDYRGKRVFLTTWSSW